MLSAQPVKRGDTLKMNIKFLACAALLAVSLAACSDKSQKEAATAGDHAAAAPQDAGAASVTAVEDAGNATADAAASASTAVNGAAEKTADAARNTAVDAKQAADKVGRKTDAAVDAAAKTQ